MDRLREETRQLAARLIVEERLPWPEARRAAAEAAGSDLPDSAAVEKAVRERLYLFHPDHAEFLAALRAEALSEMRELAAAGLDTRLVGAILNGAATRDSNIRLECWDDSGKNAEMALFRLEKDWFPFDSVPPKGIAVVESLAWLRPLRRGSRAAAFLPGENSVGVVLDVIDPRCRALNPRKRPRDRFQSVIEASGRASAGDVLRLLEGRAA